MKSYDDQLVLEVLAFLARTQSQVDGFWRHLREWRRAFLETAEVTSAVECRQYETGLVLSIWLEAEVRSGEALTWWMDIAPKDDGWLLDARLSWNGSDVVVQLPERMVPDFRTVKQEAPPLLENLFAAGKGVLQNELSS